MAAAVAPGGRGTMPLTAIASLLLWLAANLFRVACVYLALTPLLPSGLPAPSSALSQNLADGKPAGGDEVEAKRQLAGTEGSTVSAAWLRTPARGYLRI